MTLRQGVKFHNGDELTSEDVAYTFRDGRMWGEKAQIPGGRPYFGILAAVEPIDRYTVRFRTKAPDVLLEQRLASWCAWIVNKRAYEEMGFEAYSRQAGRDRALQGGVAQRRPTPPCWRPSTTISWARPRPRA